MPSLRQGITSGLGLCIRPYRYASQLVRRYESSNLLHIQRTVNKELRKVRIWLESNRLALNIDKTNFVIFHSAGKEICDNITVKIGKKKIHRENHVCFLGVLLDSTLSWKTHNCTFQKAFLNSWPVLQDKTLFPSRYPYLALP